MTPLHSPKQAPMFVDHGETSERSARPRQILLVIIACVLTPLVIAYGVGSHNEVQVCAVLIGAVCLSLAFAYPFWGLIFFVILLYARPEETFAPLRGLHMTLIAAVVATVSVVFQKLMDREAPIRHPVNTLIVGFGAVLIISTIRFGGTTNSLLNVGRLTVTGTSTALQDVGRLVALVLMVVNMVRTPSRYQILAMVVIVFTAYLSGFSIFQYFTGAALRRQGEFQAQATGIFGDPNDLSATIVAGLGLALGFAIGAKGTQRLLYALLSVVMVWAIFLSNSRGGMLALIGMTALFIVSVSRNRWFAVVFALVIAAGALKFGPSRMKSLDTSEQSANSRFLFSITGTRRFIQSPLTGIGYGGFPDINDGMTAHNTFVLCFTELGLPGYFCWVGCLYYGLRGLKPEVKEGRQAGRGKKNVGNGVPRGSPEVAPIGPPLAQPSPHTAEFYALVGARIGLCGYLMAAFWISRTYSPVLYLLMSLPLAQQIAYSGGRSDFSLTPVQRWRDVCIISGLCIASIVFIFVMAFALKG